MVFLISLGITQQYDTLAYIIAISQLIFIIVMILWRPYKRGIDNFGQITVEITTCYAFLLPLVMRFITVAENDEIFMVFILQGMVLISLALALVRVVMYYTKIVKLYLCPP